MDTASQKNCRHSFSVRRNFSRGYSDISSPQSCFPQQFHWLFNTFITDHHSILVRQKRMHCPDTNTRATNKHVYYICWLSWHRKIFSDTVWLLTTYIADLFENDNSSVLIDRTTSSGLVKQLATKQSGYLDPLGRAVLEKYFPSISEAPLDLRSRAAFEPATGVNKKWIYAYESYAKFPLIRNK